MLTTGTKAQIRYLNLVGDRYLELVDTPGSTKSFPSAHRFLRIARRPPWISICCSAA